VTSHALTGSRTRRSAVLIGRGLRTEPVVYFWAIGASALFGGLTVAISQVLGRVTDTIVVPALDGSSPAGRAWIGGLVLAAVGLGLALSVAARRIYAGIGLSNLQAHHRRAVTRRYLELPMSWHRAHPTGQLLSNVSSDVEAATGVFTPLPFALGVCVMIVIAAVALLSIDVWLAAAALVVLPLAVLVNLVFQKYMSPAITRAQPAAATTRSTQATAPAARRATTPPRWSSRPTVSSAMSTTVYGTELDCPSSWRTSRSRMFPVTRCPSSLPESPMSRLSKRITR